MKNGNMLDHEVIMLIGFPGSGKSTWIKNFFNTKPTKQYAVVSSDDIIMQWAKLDGLTYDEAHATYKTEAVTAAVINKMYGCIKQGYNIIIDQVNVSKETRAVKLRMFPETYVRKAVMFDLPLELILARQKTPERVSIGKSIPDDVMTTLRAQLVYPDNTEFSEIIYVTD